MSMECPICSNVPESIDHILFGCIRAREIWRTTSNKVYLDKNFNSSFVDRWWKINSSTSMDELELIAVTCWSIWNDRNKIIHGEIVPLENV